MGIPEWVSLVKEAGVTAVVMALGLMLFFNRARREESERSAQFKRDEEERRAMLARSEDERRELFNLVIHGDGNGQDGLKQISAAVASVQGVVNVNSGRIATLEVNTKELVEIAGINSRKISELEHSASQLVDIAAANGVKIAELQTGQEQLRVSVQELTDHQAKVDLFMEECPRISGRPCPIAGGAT